MKKIGYDKISKNLNVRKPRSPNMERDVIDFLREEKCFTMVLRVE